MKSIFLAARDQPPEELDAFLEIACAGSAALRHRVEQLLGALRDAPECMASPTVDGSGDGAEEQAGERIGHYRLLQRIGEGGFGAVFMADQERPVRRRVALKIIKLGMDSRQVIARFEAERQALAMMDHPNIARVLDAGTTERGRPYFVMELVAGEPITTYCDRHRLSLEERLLLFVQVCRAVQHAHQKSVIHRDLKPGNVLVSTQDGEPFAKVIDFGIAKATAGRLTDKTLFTEHRQLLGTPEYMSPEQVEGSIDIDTRSDIYSLGALLYELLAGSPPFAPERLRGTPLAELQRIIREVDPPTPSVRLSRGLDDRDGTAGARLAAIAAARRLEPARIAPFLRGGLDWIVMKALDKVRSRRYATAQDLAEDVERFLAGEPVLAAPASRWYRASRFVRRHQVPVTAAVAVAAALLVGAVGTTTFWLRERVQRQEALDAQRRAEAAAAAERIAGYITNVQSAMVAIGAEQAEDAKARLAACPEPLRGWEWSLVAAMAEEVPVVLPTSEYVVGFSPDGGLLLTQNWRESASVWDARTGALHARFELPRNVSGAESELPLSGEGDDWTLRFSLDGTQVIGTLSDSHWLAVWDVATEERIHFLPLGQHEGTLVGLAPKTLRAAIASEGGPLRIVDLAPWKEICVIPWAEVGKVHEVQFSPDGEKAFVRSTPPEASASGQLYTLGPLKRLGERVAVEDRGTWIADGSALLALSPDRRRLWRIDATDGAHRCVLPRHSENIEVNSTDNDRPPIGENASTADARSPETFWVVGSTTDGRLALVRSTIVGKNDPTFGLLDLTTGDWRTPFGLTRPTWTARLSDDGALAFFVERDEEGVEMPVVCATATGTKGHPITGHAGRVTSAAFSEDGTRVVTGSVDCTARVWDIASGETLAFLPCRRAVWNCGFAPDGSRCWTQAWDDGPALLWKWGSAPARSVEIGGSLNSGGPLQWHNRDAVIDRLDTGEVRIRSIATGEITRLLPRSIAERVVALRASPSGLRAVVKRESGEIVLFDTASTKPLATLAPPEERVELPTFSSDGSFLLAGTEDGQLIRWSAESANRDWSVPVCPGESLRVQACAPDDELVAAVRTWRGADGTGQSRPLLASCSDGRVVLNDQRFTAWHQWVPESREMLATVDGVGGAAEVRSGRRLYRTYTHASPLVRSLWGITEMEDPLPLPRHGGLHLGEQFTSTLGWVWTVDDHSRRAVLDGRSFRMVVPARPARTIPGIRRALLRDALGDVPPQGSCLAIAHDSSSRRVITLHPGQGGATGRLWGLDPLTGDRLPATRWGGPGQAATQVAVSPAGSPSDSSSDPSTPSPQWAIDFDFKKPEDRPEQIPLPMHVTALAGANSDDGRWMTFVDPERITVIQADGLHRVAEMRHRLHLPAAPAESTAVPVGGAASTSSPTSAPANAGASSVPAPPPLLLAIARDGSRVACIDAARRLHVWDVVDGAEPFTSTALSSADAPTALALSHDGSAVMVGFASGTVRRIECSGRNGANSDAPAASGVDRTQSASTASTASSVRTQLDGSVVSLSVSADGALCAVALDDGSITLLDPARLDPVGPTLDGPSPARVVLFTPDGSRLVAAGADGFVRIWHTAVGREVLVLRERDIASQPTCICLTADGERLVVGAADGGMRVWDAVPWDRRADELEARVTSGR